MNFMSQPSLLAALAPLGDAYTVTFIPAFTGGGSNVTLTIFAKPKEGAKNVREKTFQLAGTIAEVEKQIAEELPAVINQVVDFNQSLAKQAEQQIEADKAAAAEAASKKQDAAPASKTSATKSSPAKAKPKAKGGAAAAATAALESAPDAPAPAEPAAEPPPAGEKKLTAAEQAVLALRDGIPDDGAPL